MADMAKLSANALRRLAEQADGERNRNPVLVVDEEKNISLAFDGKLQPGQKPLIELETLNDGRGLSEKMTIRLFLGEQEIGVGTDLDQADSVFTTQSALEKFLLPYYMRTKTPSEVNDMAKQFFHDECCVAVHHLPGTIPVPDVLVKHSIRGGVPGVNVFALPARAQGNLNLSPVGSSGGAGTRDYAERGGQ